MHPSVQAVCDHLWDGLLADSPEFGTYIGHDVEPAGMDTYTVEAYENRKGLAEDVLRKLDEIDPTAILSDEDHLNIALLRRYAQVCIEGVGMRQYTMVMNQEVSPQVFFPHFTIKSMPFQTTEHYRNYFTRLRLFKKQVGQMQELMRIGVAEGITVHHGAIGQIGERLDQLITKPLHDLSFYKPLKSIPSDFPEDLQKDLITEGSQLIEENVIGTLKELKRFTTEEYIPHCRQDISLNSLPPSPSSALSRYDVVLRFHCDTQLSAREIHELGLQQVQKMENSIQKVMDKVGFHGSMRDFVEHVNSMDEHKFKSDEELFQCCEDLLASRIRPALKKLFHSFPAVPIKVTGSPFGRLTQGVYSSPKKAGESGEFMIGCGQYRVPRYLLMSLLMHEAEPGHHYQFCHILGKDDIPKFRRCKDDRKYFEVPARFPLNTAHTEGWALYCEELGKELDLYSDPYDEYGFLDQNIKRAVRMVIDPAIHALGWSREKAFEYMMKHSPLTAEIVNGELERYITFPGQACAYTYGLLRIRSLRELAEKKLGDRFDIRDFHLACIGHGQLPLDVLEDVINTYIRNTLTQTPSK